MLLYGRMLKRKSIIPHDRPVYREVIPQALKISWRNPLLWIFGIFAAVLNTGGSLDVIWKFWDSVRTQGSDLFIGDLAVNIWQTAFMGGFSALPFMQALLALVVLTVIAGRGRFFLRQPRRDYLFYRQSQRRQIGSFEKRLDCGGPRLDPSRGLKYLDIGFGLAGALFNLTAPGYRPGTRKLSFYSGLLGIFYSFFRGRHDIEHHADLRFKRYVLAGRDSGASL